MHNCIQYKTTMHSTYRTYQMPLQCPSGLGWGGGGAVHTIKIIINTNDCYFDIKPDFTEEKISSYFIDQTSSKCLDIFNT